MPLTNKTLAELARLNAGIGPVPTAQVVASDSGMDSPIQSAAFGTVLAEALLDGDGVAVDSATFAVVIVTPIGGNAVFDVVSRTETRVDKFEVLNGLEAKDQATPWKEVVFVGPEAEVVVLVKSGTATSVEVEIAPCLGG